MPGNPFDIDIDEGFENIPIVKGSGQAINKVAASGTKYTKQQAAAMTKSFVSQLYGSTAQTTTDDDQNQNVAVNTAAQAQKVKTTSGGANVPKSLAAAHIQQHAVQATNQTASTPEEQAQIAEARRLLYQQSTEYYDKDFGNIADVESDVIKEAQARQKRDQEREQEEEQEKQQLAQLEEQKKKEPPIAVSRLRNKAESNRGASG